MNGGLGSNAGLLDAIRAGVADGGGAAVCVPYPYLAQSRDRLEGSAVSWGAQDVSEHAGGAYTGEVSAGMLAEFGCRYVLVGHSDRRQYHGESSELVARKAQAVLAAGMVPVVCIGETLAEREAGQTERIVIGQLDAALALLGSRIAGCVVAYEPVWAIGTGRTATPEQAQAVHAVIRQRLGEVIRAADVPILYGGSVNAANAGTLFGCADIDGGLVGGASLKSNDFLAICRA